MVDEQVLVFVSNASSHPDDEKASVIVDHELVEAWPIRFLHTNIRRC